MRRLALIAALISGAASAQGMGGPGLSSGSFSARILAAGATGVDLTLSGNASMDSITLTGASASGTTINMTSGAGGLYTNTASASAGFWVSAISAANAGATPGTSAFKFYPSNALDATDYVLSVGNSSNGTSLFNVAYNGKITNTGDFNFGAGCFTDVGGALTLGCSTTGSTNVSLSMGTNGNVSAGSGGNVFQAMGTSGSTATALGLANATTADVTSSGASNLISYTLPANALVTTNRCLRIMGWGTALNNANAKTVALDFGSQTVISKILTPSIASTTWKVQAVVCRSGSNTQDVYAEAWNPMGTTVSSVDGNTVLYQAARTAGTQTETATITIKGKTTTATTTDVTMDGLTVEFM
jgi:hypothetical protein